MKQVLILALSVLPFLSLASNNQPIIDMHLHSYSENSFRAMPDQYGRASSKNNSQHLKETYQAMRDNHIVLGMLSTSKQSAGLWLKSDTEERFLRGVEDPQAWTPKEFEAAVKAGEVQVFGEIGTYYAGKTLDDPFYAPYLKVCEKYGIPVAVHTGGGPPRAPYTFAPNARLRYGNPYLLEEALIQYPKLKVYMMHSGETFYQEALRLMLTYPRVYTDLGVVLWVHESPKYYGEEFLKLAKRFGMLDRVMFGSDQMRWPHAIADSIERLNSFEFLTDEEKRNILYNNAARFLELDKATIKLHHQ
jgi:uncharacterized protein